MGGRLVEVRVCLVKEIGDGRIFVAKRERAVGWKMLKVCKFMVLVIMFWVKF